MTLNNCKLEDKNRLLELLEGTAKTVGHEAIKAIYHLNRKIRNELNINTFPVALFYRCSLYEKMDNEYSQISTEVMAKEEGLEIRRMYYIRKQYWKHRKEKFVNKRIL